MTHAEAKIIIGYQATGAGLSDGWYYNNRA